MPHQEKILDITIAVPLGTSHVDVRRVQQICVEVEKLVKAEYPDACYIEHEFADTVTA